MIEAPMESQQGTKGVVVACPDARPPAYQAVIGLSRAGYLDRFLTSSYYDPQGAMARAARRLAPRRFQGWDRLLRRRHDPEIPAHRVTKVPSVDLSLRLEARAGRSQFLRRGLARTRTAWFDWRLAGLVERTRPGLLLAFSDVASEITLPLCWRLGIPTILSMVHGEVHEEAEVLSREAAESPDFFSLYLGDGALDRIELAWLHRRRLRDVALADRILVPSQHIADRLAMHWIEPSKIRVIPYAADCRRFRPLEGKRHEASCTFLFAGGITQRKGIRYLLEAWERVRRPGWKLQLLGPLPERLGPLRDRLDHVEVLGRVGHAEMPGRMAAADVFVFPSLFEGSAVVTYEALACGLPGIVTPSSGSVVRDGIEGFVVDRGNVEALAHRMEQLGSSPELRGRMAQSARSRALEFDWPRYHAAVVAEVAEMIQRATPRADGRGRPIPARHEAGARPGMRVG
jgi:hypothetical protein